MKKAAWYLDTVDNITVKAVAYSLGFYDEYHFSNRFKRFMGLSPRDYKRTRAASSSAQDASLGIVKPE